MLPYVCFGRLLDIVNTDKTIKQFEKFSKITKIAFVLLLYLCKEYLKKKVISSLVFAKFCEKNEKKKKFELYLDLDSLLDYGLSLERSFITQRS